MIHLKGGHQLKHNSCGLQILYNLGNREVQGQVLMMHYRILKKEGCGTVIQTCTWDKDAV